MIFPFNFKTLLLFSISEAEYMYWNQESKCFMKMEGEHEKHWPLMTLLKGVIAVSCYLLLQTVRVGLAECLANNSFAY
jgi:hypothetical protein